MGRVTPLKIAGWGEYRPRRNRDSTELDAVFGREPGWTEREFGIRTRGVAARDETTSMMGAEAAERALAKAGWAHGEFDVLIGACGVMEQPIPSTSVLIQRRLGLGDSGILSFDVNQTCLSFAMALDLTGMAFAAGRWKRALIVSSDIASAGLDASVPKTASIFGDGAAAMAIESQETVNGPSLLASRFETYGSGSDLATLETGGTRIRIEDGFEALADGARFRMDPFGIFKAAARHLPRIVGRVLGDAGLTHDDVDHVVCHQASAAGIELARREFQPRPDRVVNIFPFTGNQIAASIPTALGHVLDGPGRPGQIVLVVGTSAGLSAGAMVLRL